MLSASCRALSAMRRLPSGQLEKPPQIGRFLIQCADDLRGGGGCGDGRVSGTLMSVVYGGIVFDLMTLHRKARLATAPMSTTSARISCR
jgi:hypothetical protein